MGCSLCFVSKFSKIKIKATSLPYPLSKTGFSHQTPSGYFQLLFAHKMGCLLCFLPSFFSLGSQWILIVILPGQSYSLASKKPIKQRGLFVQGSNPDSTTVQLCKISTFQSFVKIQDNVIEYLAQWLILCRQQVLCHWLNKKWMNKQKLWGGRAWGGRGQR